VFRIGGTIIPKRQDDPNGKLPDRRQEVVGASTGSSAVASAAGSGQGSPAPGSPRSEGPAAAPHTGRTIRFPDEAPPLSGVGQTPATAAAAAAKGEHMT
jgi:hypothetical protein